MRLIRLKLTCLSRHGSQLPSHTFRTKHFKLVLVITNHLRCIDGTNPNLAERLCRTISTEVEDPYSRVHESQFSKPVC